MTSFDEYQAQAAKTAVYPESQAFEYLALGLTSEAGEVASLVKKAIRDQTPLDKVAMLGELGDCLWYVARLATTIDASLEWLADVNLRKLADRAQRGVLGGSGDNR